MEDFIEGLKKVEQDLAYFVSPENKDGFIKEFASWVYGEWSKNDFYETDIVDLGYDCSSYPEKTNQSLSDKCSTYADFINANTGFSECTHVSGQGMRCQEYEEKLLEIFGEATAKKIDELVELYKLEVPEKYKKHAKNISELIFHELVDYSDDSELYDLCDYILFKYNQLGVASQPYTCPVVGWDDDNDRAIYCDESIFKDYTLEDFKKLAEID
ncbi:hypothetical protein MXL26_10580 [Acinetobacter towneri]|uniref:hypothetical protein n=1 Tax=Acinetobacter towneri TaxID=202956 RepID=UPI002DB62B17|nr:hypothetical protein [Acinetobacter towneri]MEB6565785.1 hypothetical protein [Acinetobacter towneri]